jgi:ribonuclease-3 family protein
MSELFKTGFSPEETGKLSSLGLAYVGDAVFELYIRLRICKQGRLTASGMHGFTVDHVNAHAQSAYAEKLLPILSAEELSVYKRGRNAKVHNVPKNADTSEYHSATGLEALIGYLFCAAEPTAF